VFVVPDLFAQVLRVEFFLLLVGLLSAAWALVVAPVERDWEGMNREYRAERKAELDEKLEAELDEKLEAELEKLEAELEKLEAELEEMLEEKLEAERKEWKAELEAELEAGRKGRKERMAELGKVRERLTRLEYDVGTLKGVAAVSWYSPPAVLRLEVVRSTQAVLNAVLHSLHDVAVKEVKGALRIDFRGRGSRTLEADRVRTFLRGRGLQVDGHIVDAPWLVVGSDAARPAASGYSAGAQAQVLENVLSAGLEVLLIAPIPTAGLPVHCLQTNPFGVWLNDLGTTISKCQGLVRRLYPNIDAIARKNGLSLNLRDILDATATGRYAPPTCVLHPPRAAAATRGRGGAAGAE
jgi:hypothetical protein